MKHIHQINSVPYTVIVADEPLESHISIIENPNLFEIVDSEIPSDAQYLNYQSDVPLEVPLWAMRNVLKKRNLFDLIIGAINQLDEPLKTDALDFLEYGNFIERYSNSVLLIQQITQISSVDVNNLFIEANNIKL